MKSLSIKYFDEIDELLKTDYARLYPTSLRETKLLQAMARVASIHGLGLLVIDELQHLSRLKSGGHRKMLNFFVELVNTIGVPVMLISNPAGEDLLSAEFRQARRLSDVGDIVWDPIPKPAQKPREDTDPATPLSEWEYFLHGLWRYQYTQNPVAWDSKEGRAIRSALFEATQGITHFVTRLWIVSQERAIDSRREQLSDAIVLSTAKDQFRLANKVLHAIARRDWNALKKFDDVYYTALEQLWTTPIETASPESDLANWLKAEGFSDEVAKTAAKQALKKTEPEAEEPIIRRTAFRLADAMTTAQPSPESTPNSPAATRGKKTKPDQKPAAIDLDDSLATADEWTATS